MREAGESAVEEEVEEVEEVNDAIGEDGGDEGNCADSSAETTGCCGSLVSDILLVLSYHP